MSTPTLHLYLDDSGARYPDRKQPFRNDGLDHFALGGLLISSECIDDASRAHAELVSRYELTDPLHSSSIRARKRDFAWLEQDIERARCFYADLERTLIGLPGYATGCIVHRPGYNSRYRDLYGAERWDLCKSAYTIVVERAAKIAIKSGKRLMVYVEATGKKEDGAIRRYHADLRAAGMYFDVTNSAKYSPMGASDFASALFVRPNFISKAHPLSQFSDLLLYPLVKGRYDPGYPPYRRLNEAGRVIDTVLDDGEREALGVKYYCFDGF